MYPPPQPMGGGGMMPQGAPNFAAPGAVQARQAANQKAQMMKRRPAGGAGAGMVTGGPAPVMRPGGPDAGSGGITDGSASHWSTRSRSRPSPEQMQANMARRQALMQAMGMQMPQFQQGRLGGMGGGMGGMGDGMLRTHGNMVNAF